MTHAKRKLTDEQRLENLRNKLNAGLVRIQPTGCRVWIGAKNEEGYGQVKVNKKRYLVHRIVYVLTYGPLAKGKFVCHHCDNTSCAEPTHLYAGTAKDNTRDRIRRERTNRGATRLLKTLLRG